MANTLKIKRGAAASIPTGQLAEPLFTSDTYDLYIGTGASNQRFQKYIASGTSSQFLKGDGSLDSTSYQTALTFSSPLVNTSGTISIPVATGSVDGYLSSTDWTTFNSKEPAITAGTTLQYYRGDKTFQTLDTAAVPENGAIYFTEPRVRATVLTGLNLSGGGTIAATDSVLTAFGKLQNQISAVGTGVTYQGTWNASTNTPTLASGTGTKGYYYVVSVAGSTNIDGITDWNVGDWIIFNGTAWDKVDNTDAVSSVNGFTGAVNLALDNISDVSAASPTNAQLLRFNGTSSLWENWTPTFEPALTKGNLTEATSSVLTITGGTGAVIGSGTSIEVKQASGSVSGYLSSTDWTTFNNKQSTITLTTTGTSGAATFSSNTLNIPQYQAALTNPVTGTGTSAEISYWSNSSQITSSSTFTFSPTGKFLVNNSAAAGGIGVDFTSTVNANANNDIIYGLRVNPTFNNGVYTGVTQRALGVFGSVYINGSLSVGAITATAISGTSAMFSSSVTASSLVKSGGTSSQYLMADGSISTLTNPVTGTGTTNYLPKFTSSSTIGNSNLQSDASGNLGLGVTPSAWSTFKAFELPNIGFLASAGAYIQVIANGVYNGTNYTYKTSNVATMYAQAVGQHQWFTAPSGTAGNTFTFTQAMTLGSNSGLSIGTITAAAANGLLVAGAATFSSSVTANGSATTNAAFIANNTVGSGGTSQYYIDFTAGASTIGRIFRGNGASGVVGNGLNIDNFDGFQIRLNQLGGSGGTCNILGGNVGINDTSPSSTINSTSTPVLSLKSTTAAYPSYVLKYINGAEGGITLAGSLYIDIGGNSTASNNAIVFRTIDTNSSYSTTERMRITSGGATQIKGTLQTYAPGSTTTLGDTWKFGGYTATTVSFVTTGYIYVEVNGTGYYLALANPL